MEHFYNLFSWKDRIPNEQCCYFKTCILNVPMAALEIGTPVDVIIQDYEKSVFIVKSHMGETHVPYRVICDSISSKYQDLDRVTETLIKRIKYLENQ